MKWLRNLPEWVLWILLSPIVALAAIWIASLAGCATFDAPKPAVIEMHGDVLKWPVRCGIVYDKVTWVLTVNVGECKGYQAI